MRGTFFKSSYNFSVARRRSSQTYFLLVFAIIFAAVFSGCASVSANKPSAEPATAQISVVPSAVDFKAVVVGQKNSQTVKITNTSKNPISLQQLRVSGSGFTLSSSSAAVSLAAGNAVNLTVVFSPVNSSAATGSLVISSADLKNPVTVPLAGSGEKAAAALTASPASINFGAHGVKSSTSQAVTLSNTGNISVSLSSIDLPGSAFSLSGLSKGVSLAPGQELQFQVWFRPGAAGGAAETLSINGSSLPAPLRIAFSGSASNSAPEQTSTPAHSVTLNWQPSASAIEGYHVYRADVSNGPYKRINASIVTNPSYKDDTVAGGGHYFYVVTAVKADGTESAYSNEVAVNIPSP
jgi:Abnormal spindle-like microcephaly-assoc'd, ASPM-SPD-2-Hydin